MAGSMHINFVTGNKLKFDVAKAYFVPFGNAFVLKQLTINAPEIQAETVQEVAIYSAQEIVRQTGEPCIVSDVGLVIEALDGFPGPFLRYANQWLGIDGYLKLLAGEENRRAYFEDALALAFPDGTVQTFTRREYGHIAKMGEATKPGWAANDLFIPAGHDIPLGQLSHDEQVAFWGDGSWPDVVKYLQQREDAIPSQRRRL